MDRNSLIGLVLIAGILIGYGILVSPSKEDIARQKFVNDSIAAVQAKQAPKPVAKPVIAPADTLKAVDSASVAAAQLALNAQYGDFGVAARGTETEQTIETDKLIITFSSKGGRIKDVVLKEYKTYDSTALHLFDPASSVFGFDFKINGKGAYSTRDFYFTPTITTTKVSGNTSAVISYRLPTSDPSKYLELVYTLKGNAYDLNLKVNLVGMEGALDPSQKIAFNWQAAGLDNEKSLKIQRQHSSVYFRNFDDDRDYLNEAEDGEDEEILEEKTNWVAYKQHFFSAVVISKEGFVPENSMVKVSPAADSTHTKIFTSRLTLPLANLATASTDLQFFFGPNDFEVLGAYDIDEFDRIIDYGWGIFGWVNKFFIYYVFSALNSLNLGVGIAILLLTIVIKMLLMPLTYKNYQSSAKMRILKPEVDAINAKMKDADPMKKQQEMMALYRKTGVNPLAGCLPVLIQMPFLYAMFRFFPAAIELRHKPFLWADDLSSYDSIYTFGHVPFINTIYGDHISLFTILMCASTFVYTRMNSGNMPAPQQGMPDMRFIMYLFPFMMLFFFNNYASGLSWYYFAANVVTMLQTWVIRKYFVDEKKLIAAIEENKKKPAGKSNFQKKLEDMAKSRGYKLPK